jgi:hypothetical protein
VVPGGLLASPPLVLAPGPPNGDLSVGLEGWIVLGRETPAALPAGRGVLVRGNTTLVSPPVVVPPGAQSLRVTLRAAASEGLVVVSARAETGGPDVPLGSLEPGPRRAAPAVTVPAALAGAVVRIVLDPVPALGTGVEVLRVGPFTAPIPGWTVGAGVLEVAGARGRRTVRVAGDPLRLAAPPFRPPAVARALLVGVRGDGVLRAHAGARTVAARAGARWRSVRIPLRAGPTDAVVLSLTATPGPGGMELRRLGVVERRPARSPGRSGGSGSR